VRKKTLAQALSKGVAQLRENDYGAELRAAGAPVGHAFAVAFDGKKVRVKAVMTEGKKARAAAKRGGMGKQRG
jgi:hypothetical protein